MTICICHSCQWMPFLFTTSYYYCLLKCIHRYLYIHLLSQNILYDSFKSNSWSFGCLFQKKRHVKCRLHVRSQRALRGTRHTCHYWFSHGWHVWLYRDFLTPCFVKYSWLVNRENTDWAQKGLRVSDGLQMEWYSKVIALRCINRAVSCINRVLSTEHQ